MFYECLQREIEKDTYVILFIEPFHLILNYKFASCQKFVTWDSIAHCSTLASPSMLQYCPACCNKSTYFEFVKFKL